ncbi:unnamed protein product, partial [Brenthis ino]
MLFGYAQTQDANCNYEQNVIAGRDYYIYSPNYPNNYNAGAQCRWIGNCPIGYNCRLDCGEINLPQTPSCSGDRLVISTAGDPLLTSGDTYCGTGSLTAVSTGQRISIGLITASNTTGGKFSCKLTAQLQSMTDSCQCGYQRANRIVGGTETRPNEFPMMAGIVYVDEAAIKCGAVIISRNAVVTASHCVINKGINEIGVIVGEHDTRTGADSNATQLFRVSRIITHPYYTPANYDYDVAIVKVLGQIIFSALVGPVCLPFKYRNSNYDFTGDTVTVLGWGTLAPGGTPSKVLRKVDLNVISQSVCRQSFSSVTPRQMCTYTRGKDACQDDSGGPLLYRDPNIGVLFNIGIVSFGTFCASTTPGINTRITAVLDWILSTAPDNYCIK